MNVVDFVNRYTGKRFKGVYRDNTVKDLKIIKEREEYFLLSNVEFFDGYSPFNMDLMKGFTYSYRLKSEDDMYYVNDEFKYFIGEKPILKRI